MNPRILLTLGALMSVSLASCGRPVSEPKLPSPGKTPPVSVGAPEPLAPTPLNEEAARERMAKSVEGLLQQIPKAKAPKPGSNGIVERNEATAWLAKTIVDKPIEVLLPVADLQIDDGLDGQYDIDLLLSMDADSEVPKKLSDGYPVGTLPIGGIPCRVEVRGGAPIWPNVDSAAAKERRKLKDNQVLFRARIVDAEFHAGADDNQLLLAIGLTDFQALHSTPIGVWLAANVQMPRRRAAGIATGARLHGTVKLYDAADRLICVENYQEGKKHGLSTFYYPNGGKNTEGNFIDDLFQGKGTRWYPDGKLLGTSDMVDGQLHGKTILYYKNGNKCVEAPCVRGKNQGRGDSYAPDGRHYSIMTWEDGKLVNEEFLIKLTPEEQEQAAEANFSQAQWKAMWENQ